MTRVFFCLLATLVLSAAARASGYGVGGVAFVQGGGCYAQASVAVAPVGVQSYAVQTFVPAVAVQSYAVQPVAIPSYAVQPVFRSVGVVSPTFIQSTTVQRRGVFGLRRSSVRTTTIFR